VTEGRGTITHRGGCHCGALRLTFETAAPLTPRACQCGFCRRHGARTVADPAGRATLTWTLPPIRYRFGLEVTDYLICARCGVYVGAETEVEGRRLATLNLNAFDDPRLELAATPVSYDGETADSRGARRLARWTPLFVE
jgi:hypothetical protein